MSQKTQTNSQSKEAASRFRKTSNRSSTPAVYEANTPIPLQKAHSNPGLITDGDLLQLHQTVGNRVVQRIFTGHRQTRKVGTIQQNPTEAEHEEKIQSKRSGMEIRPVQHVQEKANNEEHSESTEQLSVVQRKIGFEFETGLGLMKEKTLFEDKQNPFYIGKGFDIVSDSGNMEFRTDPFNEDKDGEKAKDIAVEGLVNTADLILNLLNKKETKVDTLGKGVKTEGLEISVPKEIENEIKSSKLKARPQATVGVEVNKIPDWMGEISKDKQMVENSQNQKLVNEAGEIARKIALELAMPKNNRIQGLFSLMALYVLNGRYYYSKDHILDYPKAGVPILGKTSLSHIYESISDDELEKLGKNPGETLLTLFKKHLNIKDDDCLFPGGYKHYKDKNVIEYGPTIKDWIQGIVTGKEIFAGTNKAKFPAPGFGIKNLEWVGVDGEKNEKAGAIMELRNMEAPVYHDKWKPFADSVYKKIKTRNSDKCFITTACVKSRGLPDDCEELMILRSFRDNYLMKKENGPQLVEIYYKYSPSIVEAIDKQENAATVYEGLYHIIRDCVDAIKKEDNEAAFQTYCEMVMKLKEQYLPEAEVPYMMEHVTRCAEKPIKSTDTVMPIQKAELNPGLLSHNENKK